MLPLSASGKELWRYRSGDIRDLDTALDIVVNAKTQRPGVCNAMETLLIHDYLLYDAMPRLAANVYVDPAAVVIGDRADRCTQCPADSISWRPSVAVTVNVRSTCSPGGGTGARSCAGWRTSSCSPPTTPTPRPR